MKRYPAVTSTVWYIAACIFLGLPLLGILLTEGELGPKLLLFYGILGIPLFAITALTLKSLDKHNTIVIDNTALFVGKKSVALKDIDSSKSKTLADGKIKNFEMIEGVTDYAVSPLRNIPISEGGLPQILGGAWGVPLSWSYFIVILKDDNAYCVPVKKSDRSHVIAELESKLS